MLSKIIKRLPSSDAGSQIDRLISALPELYQPIFGRPVHQGKPISRACADRLIPIVAFYQALESKLKRPLRVIDLGCAQGFFSFSLAELGATVHGVDYLNANIAVCRAVADQHPELKTSFQSARIEDILKKLAPDQYDLVLGLSVFHHMVHEAGVTAVKSLMAQLCDKVVAGIFEMALANEPLYWGKSQPKDPSQLLDSFAFVHELSHHKTHLSSTPRPLYVASNRYWYLSGQVGAFETWQADSHKLAIGNYQNTRRYFFGNGLVAKVYSLDHETLGGANLLEYSNETNFLQNAPPDYKVPRLLLHGLHEREAWLVREYLSGELLFDIIFTGRPYDTAHVLKDILKQLVMLESAGLYHSDVRTWNVIVGSDGAASLIDYGAISMNQKDCAWPHDVFLSFFIFVHEVITGQVGPLVPLRKAAISPCQLGSPYREWAMKFWSYPGKEWSFRLLLQLFEQISVNDDNHSALENRLFSRWMKAMEEAVDAQSVFAQRQISVLERLDALEQKVRYSLLERIIRNLRDYYQKKRAK